MRPLAARSIGDQGWSTFSTSATWPDPDTRKHYFTRKPAQQRGAAAMREQQHAKHGARARDKLWGRSCQWCSGLMLIAVAATREASLSIVVSLERPSRRMVYPAACSRRVRACDVQVRCGACDVTSWRVTTRQDQVPNLEGAQKAAGLTHANIPTVT